MPPKLYFSFFLGTKISEVKCTFLTLTAEIWPAYCHIVFLESHEGDCCFLFPFSSNHHFFKGSADDLSPLTLSFCHKWTNACVKNLRHGFLAAHVKISKCDVYRSLPFILSGTGAELTQTYALAKNVSTTLSLTTLRFLKEWAIIWNY